MAEAGESKDINLMCQPQVGLSVRVSCRFWILVVLVIHSGGGCPCMRLFDMKTVSEVDVCCVLNAVDPLCLGFSGTCDGSSRYLKG